MIKSLYQNIKKVAPTFRCHLCNFYWPEIWQNTAIQQDKMFMLQNDDEKYDYDNETINVTINNLLTKLAPGNCLTDNCSWVHNHATPKNI